MLTIIDYSMGNLHSVGNALDRLGVPYRISASPEALESADGLILPGVGAFPDAVRCLKEKGLLEPLRARAAAGTPLLGICLGMQLLFDRGEEVRPCEGLGLVHGHVGRILTERKLPHIGWNSLKLQNDAPLFAGLPEESYVYFVHSFCGYADDERDVIARTEYGPSVVAAVARNGVYGCQFHPEKSGDVGLHILKNFGGLSQ